MIGNVHMLSARGAVRLEQNGFPSFLCFSLRMMKSCVLGTSRPECFEPEAMFEMQFAPWRQIEVEGDVLRSSSSFLELQSLLFVMLGCGLKFTVSGGPPATLCVRCIVVS
jgi:hypothetical protein